MDIDILQASDGNGDPPLMHVTEDRLSGATTLKVDSVVNVPTKFIATSGTLLPSGFIDQSTKMEFVGHLSGSNLIIDSIEPGSTDDGNTEGQVVTIKSTAGWANRVYQLLKAIYPVGSIYSNATDNTNPADLLGFGTWVAIPGRFLVGVGASDQTFNEGDTGGESDHTLITGEMPAHSHTLGENGYGGVKSHVSGHNDIGGGTLASYAGNTTSSVGGGAAHNNLPPYKAVYMWERTA